MTYQTDVQGALWFQFVFFSSGALECTAESIPSPSLARKNHTEAGATRSPKVAGFSISAWTASSKTSLHLANARQLCAMRKLIGMAARLIPLALIASVASCQSGRNRGAGGPGAQITDPNTVFAQGGAHTGSSTGTTGGASSRRGRGAAGGF